MSDTSDTNAKKSKPISPSDEVIETREPADPTPADVAVEEPVVDTKPARKPRKTAATATATGEVQPTAEESTSTDPTPAETVPSTTAETAATDTTTPADTAPASQFAGREVVYVQAPTPPKLRGNRGVGSLLAVLGAVLFAALYGAIAFVVIALGGTSTGVFGQFIQNAVFWVPVLIFLVAFVLLVLIVNRAGWAAHVFGSLVVALAVYFGTIGVLLLLDQFSGGEAHTFADAARNPFVIVSAIVAREVSIWIGLAIAARGRRVKARNLELVDEWETEHAETKAQYERAGATA